MRIVITALFLACCTASIASAEEAPLVVEAKIPLGAVKGRIDHLAIDRGRNRLFIAELGNGSVSAVDLNSGKVMKRIEGLDEPQGVAYAAGPDLVYVASGGDGTVRRYRGEDLSPVGEKLKLGDDADNVRVAADGSRVVVGYGSGALAVLDAASGVKLGEVHLPAHPESFQLERNGSRVFVNLPNASEVGVVDLAAGKQVARWAAGGVGANFPMAIDEAAGRLLVVYRRPAMLIAFDARSGEIAARLPTVGDADDVFVDAKRRRLYVTGGEGAVAVIDAGGAGYAEIGRVRTQSGARTALFVPERDRLYVAVRASGNEPAAVWVLRPPETGGPAQSR